MTTADTGLSPSEVAERESQGLTNKQPKDTSRSFWSILRANVFTLFNGIVGGCFLLLLLLGQWKDALFGFSAVANAIIGVVQEYKAKRQLDQLALLNAPRARVRRGGETQEIAVESVVLDDVLVLRSGDQVPADAVVLLSEGLELDESLLTGESDAVHKQPGDEVLSGSAVVAGQGTARVHKVGADSFASKLTAEAKKFSLIHSELRQSLDRILKWISWAIFPIIAIVVNGQMQAFGGWGVALGNGDWVHAVVGAIAAVISMIPLGLVLMTSVAFAVGGVKLSQENVLIQELPAVEVLARVDVVCLDKTGTLTQGEVMFDEATPVTAAVPGWQQVLAVIGSDTNANATAKCLQPAFPQTDVVTPTTVVPFSSARKWSAFSFGAASGSSLLGEQRAAGEGQLHGTWVFGAPDFVLAAETTEYADELRRMRELAESGKRTLLLAHSPELLSDDETNTLPRNLTPVVIVTFREKLRPDAAQTLQYFKEQGVQLRIISGDNPATVAAVASEVGLEYDGKGIDARQLPHDLDGLGKELEDHHVFGRVTPDQKKDMVLALQKRGHVVAMTGDGVNDALALKKADIGIAMGSGAAATRAVSRLVLLDGEFSHLPSVVKEGRQVIANIERVSMLFLSKTVYAIAIAVLFGLMLWDYPFLPRQLSITDGLTIGIPAFFLALMPNARRYVVGFMRRALQFAVPSGLVVTGVILAVNVFAGVHGGYSQAEIRTASVIGLTLTGLWILGVLSRPLNVWRVAILVAMYVGLALLFLVPPVVWFLDLHFPQGDLLYFTLGISVAGSVCIEFVQRMRRRVDIAG